jgi:hypothetical protein
MEFEGDMDGDENLMGAIARRMGGRIRDPQVPQRPLQRTARLRSFMGTGQAIWTAADATDKPLQVEPQESFEGNRLVIDVIAVGGVSAGLVLLRRIDVGTQPQSPSVEQPAPAAMFRPDATYANLDLQIAYRANKIITTLGITAAPGAGVTVTAVAGFYGVWIR